MVDIGDFFDPDPEVILIDDNVPQDLLYGVILGGMFIALNVLAPVVSIGAPTEALAVATSVFLLVGIGAPIIEEVAFRGLLYSTFTIFMSPIIAGIAQAAVFSAYHVTAYGLGLQAAFIGAFMFGIIAWIIARYTNSLVPAIVMHMIFNTFLLTTARLSIGVPV